jgi:GR25 family glycosyltransferase involved in LPS biosynthesis
MSTAHAAVRRPMNISVRWINMAADTARASRMRSLLAHVEAQAHAEGSAFLDVQRLDAVVPTCGNRSGPCKLNRGASYWSEHDASLLETQKARLHQEPRVRAALMGVWLSTLTAFKRFAESSSTSNPYLMVLEDDAGLSKHFFRWLPVLLRSVPANFHVVRFSCWGARFEEDRIAPDVYRAAYHPFVTERGPAGFLHSQPWVEDRGFAYGGAHVMLVQRATVDELIDHLLAIGIIPFDLSIRESVPSHQRPPKASRMLRSNRTTSSHTKIRSFVVDTSLAWDDRTTSTRTNVTREWRVPSARAGSNKQVPNPLLARRPSRTA